MRMVFEAAKKAGWLAGRRLDFMGFGLVQGQDGTSETCRFRRFSCAFLGVLRAVLAGFSWFLAGFLARFSGVKARSSRRARATSCASRTCWTRPAAAPRRSCGSARRPRSASRWRCHCIHESLQHMSIIAIYHIYLQLHPLAFF